MALDSIVIDNTVFNYFLKIKDVDLSNILRSTITGRVFVPSEIVVEMVNIQIKHPELIFDIEKLKNQISKNNFFIHCHSFDSIVLEFAMKNIHKGEAEAVAQCIKRRVPYFITDDTRSIPFINKNYNNINVLSTFFLIAVADLNGLINYTQVFKEYHDVMDFSKIKSSKKLDFHQKKLVHEYSIASKIYGISLSNKQLDLKTNINLILNEK